MSIRNPNATPRAGTADIILRSQIEEAQRHTNSNTAAARWLNVSYERYRKYAKLYNLFDRHLNKEGFGIEKGFSKRPTSIPLHEILAGKHPEYSLAKLKNRLIARKKLPPECALCGFHEKRITDGQTPLMLRFLDGNRKNFTLANLQLYCYNCMFLTTGAPSVVYKKHIRTSFTHPDQISKSQSRPLIPSDAIDIHDVDPLLVTDITLNEEELQALWLESDTP